MPSGTLLYEVRDQGGRHIPAKILLWQNNREVKRISAIYGKGSVEVVPGSYDVSVTRGFEYTHYQSPTPLVIYPNQITPLQVSLTHVVDTTGYMAFDGHMHAGPSGDNSISIPDRIATVAAEGLEVAISTDHEYVGSWQFGIDELDLGDWVATVVGQEVTCTIPEHINMFAVEPDPTHPRGGFVKWWGEDIGEVFQLIYDRGAQIIQINHPRDYMSLIEYNHSTGKADLADPTVLALQTGDSLWSWNFDAIEYQNGHDNVFDKYGGTGLFEDWMSFLNHGHPITAHANTDVHNWGTPGEQRNYFPASSDSPAEFVEAEMVDAIKRGRIVASTGAFARVRAFDIADGDSAGMGNDPPMTISSNTIDLWVHIEAIPEIDVTHYKVFVNCDEELNVTTLNPLGVIKYDGDTVQQVPVTQDSNVVVMGFGQERYPRGFDNFNAANVPRFTTNAIFIDRDGNGIYDPPGWDGCTYTMP
jgi:hypothetical protein